jgi:hypothetical protein
VFHANSAVDFGFAGISDAVSDVSWACLGWDDGSSLKVGNGLARGWGVLLRCRPWCVIDRCKGYLSLLRGSKFLVNPSLVER